jgi:hypothetical protein
LLHRDFHHESTQPFPSFQVPRCLANEHRRCSARDVVENCQTTGGQTRGAQSSTMGIMHGSMSYVKHFLSHERLWVFRRRGHLIHEATIRSPMLRGNDRSKGGRDDVEMALTHLKCGPNPRALPRCGHSLGPQTPECSCGRTFWMYNRMEPACRSAFLESSGTGLGRLPVVGRRYPGFLPPAG